MAGDRDDDELRTLWRQSGGRFHGPNVETGCMPESQLLPFLRALLAERDALQAKVEAMEKDAGRWQTMRLLIRQSNTIGEYGLNYTRREPVPNGLGTYVWKDDASIDAAIDAARAALAQPTGEKP